MKRLSVLVGVVLLVAAVDLAWVSGGGEAGKSDLNNVPYYPLKVGSKWEYLAGGKKVVVEVKAHEKVGGEMCARLETDSGGVVLTEHLTVKDGYVIRVQANGQPIDPPFKVFKLPAAAKADETWSNTCKAQGFDIKATLKMTEDKNKLHVGSAAGGKDYENTWKVDAAEMKVGNQDAKMTSWFDKDAGMVKQIFALPGAGVDVTLELDKFTPGK
jgi:hypothetical protein